MSTRRRPLRQGRACGRGALRTFTEYSSILSTCSVTKGLHSCPTFMYNWLRPVSCGQAGPTVSRPTRGLGRQPGCWTTPYRANLNPFHQVILTFVYNSSYYYIRVHIQVILHCLTRGPAHHCLHRDSFTPTVDTGVHVTVTASTESGPGKPVGPGPAGKTITTKTTNV